MTPGLLHPSADRLKRYADGELNEPRLTAHLERCTRCRAAAAELRALRRTLARLPAPEPPANLLARILASRAAGARAILPAPDLPLLRRSYLGSATAAAAAVAALGWVAFVAVRPRAGGSEAAPRRLPAPLLEGGPLVPSVALRQEAGSRERRPRYPVVTAFDPSRVRAGRWTYELVWITDGVFTSPQGHWTMTLAAGSYEGKPAWLMTGARDVRGRSSDLSDTVLVDRASLRPLRHARSGRNGRFLFAQEFSPDSVAERLYAAAPPKERTFKGTAALPGPRAGPLLVSWSWYSLRALVPALPLKRGWRGSVYSVNWVSMTDRLPAFSLLDLRVTGADRVAVPAGTFECWRLELKEGEEKSLLWVSKDQRWAVKMQHTWSGDSGEWRTEARLVSVDTALTPPAP